MKTKIMCLSGIFMLAVSFCVHAQTTQNPVKPMIVQTMYLNPGPDAEGINLDSLLTVYKKNIIDPNQQIKSSKILSHWWGADSREILMIYELGSFGSVVETFERQNELVEEYVKDNPQFLEQWQTVMSNSHHGDEIYRIIAE